MHTIIVICKLYLLAILIDEFSIKRNAVETSSNIFPYASLDNILIDLYGSVSMKCNCELNLV